MKRLSLLGLVLTLAIPGCVDIEYVGQTFPANPETHEIAFFPPDVPVPEGEYRAIGRATLTAPASTETAELQDDLILCEKGGGEIALRLQNLDRQPAHPLAAEREQLLRELSVRHAVGMIAQPLLRGEPFVGIGPRHGERVERAYERFELISAADRGKQLFKAGILLLLVLVP